MDGTVRRGKVLDDDWRLGRTPSRKAVTKRVPRQQSRPRGGPSRPVAAVLVDAGDVEEGG